MFTFKITQEYVQAVLDEMGVTSATEEGIDELIASLDVESIEKAALLSTDPDEQTSYASAEAKAQIQEAMREPE
ncbi:hypothetical protein [Photobacterium kishitanii]|uniref:Uncharacterized protein n=1 Tax=Photobacterium kishitanii TaxID=318456 RepID=A0A2T3KLB0_9GAMM|nr:hypothetical protein [Photobacterium kishitanii]PSV00492.1 hypothetical protein C9J27_04990 [Photobacterium kishitanii]